MRRTIQFATAFGGAVLVAAASSFAHHSFAGVFDANKVVRMKGVIIRSEWVNPHSFVYVDVTGAGGGVEQWALEGPSMVQLTRRSADTKALAVGQTIEACGYGMKDVVVSTASDSLKRFSGRLINAELIVLPDGQRLVWAGYGTGKCLEPRDRQ